MREGNRGPSRPDNDEVLATTKEIIDDARHGRKFILVDDEASENLTHSGPLNGESMARLHTTTAKVLKIRGRPAGKQQHDLALGLLTAAEARLEQKSYSEITSREIAELAGANQAMIGYYYDCKEGLFSALVAERIKKIDKDLAEFERNIGSIQGCYTRHFMAFLVHRFLSSPEIHRIITYELANKNSLIRQWYVGRGAKNFDRVCRIITRLVEMGVYRADTNVRYAAFTIMCLITAPITLSPILDLLDLSIEELRGHVWIEHLSSMLIAQFGAKRICP